MAGSWDGKLKMLVTLAAQDIISWLLKGATIEQELSPHLQNRNIDADVLYLVVIHGKRCLVHIEFQRVGDDRMEQRIWEYNMLATCKFGLPVISFVIYLKKKGIVARSPYTWQVPDVLDIHRFQFIVIKLWELSVQELMDMGLKGILPLLTLAQAGKSKAVVEQAIAGLSPAEENRDLLALTYGFASLVFDSEQDRFWLKRRFSVLGDILAESWAFQELIEQGLERGLEQGLERGLEQGLAQSLDRDRQLLLAFTKSLFPNLLKLAEEKAADIHDPEQLQQLILKVGLAQTEEEAQQHLLQSKPSKKSKAEKKQDNPS